MKLTLNFTELGKNDAMIAGGKGASLGEMTQAGIPVPSGFVILSTTFDEFIKEADLVQEIDAVIDGVNHKDINSVEVASEKIQALIKNAKMPERIASEIKTKFKDLDTEFVAVRSSATAEDGADNAWAGQLDSFLNTKEANLLEKVQHCWASLFTPRAIFYRFEKGLHTTKISVAVVVQKMVNSEVSGIAFSVHPVTEDRNQMIIEAGFGLGEAIVSGSITPDSYVVEKEPRRIIDINVSTQPRALYRVETGGNEWIGVPEPKASSQVLTKKQILKFADLIMKIENHYGFPCDIEWAFEKGKFYIVQSRPITTLSKQGQAIVNKEEQLQYDNSDWFLTITRNMSFWHQCLSDEGHYHNTKDFGVNAKLQVLHITVDSTQTSCFMTNPNYTEYAKAVLDAVSSEKAIKNLKIKYFELAKKLESSLSQVKKNLTITSLDNFIKEYRRFTSGLMITATLGRSGAEKLTALLKGLGYKDNEIPEINAVITYPDKHTPLFNSQLDLLRIGIKVQNGEIKNKGIKQALEIWLSQHSYIPVNFCEDPWTFIDAKNQLENFLKKDCMKEYEFAEQGHNERVEKARKLIKKINDNQVKVLAHAVAEGTFLNEFRKNIFSKISLDYRSIFKQIAIRGGSKNWRDCFFLTPYEMMDIVLGESISIPIIVKERQIAGLCVKKNGKSVILDKKTTSLFFEYISRAHGTISDETIKESFIKGSSANKGVVRGIVKIILNSKDFNKLNVGEILVTTMTSVDFVPVMERASAFITNEGGITSHASIVAREMNKPCIIGTKIATKVLKDGDIVEVDADKGIIKIINKTKENGEWVFMWSTTPLMSTYWATALASKDRRDIYENSNLFSYYDGSIITTYNLKSCIDNAKKQGERFLNLSYYNEYKKKYKKEAKVWWLWVRRIENKNYLKTSVAELIGDYRQFMKYSRDAISYFGSTRTEFTYAAEQRLEEILKKYYKEMWPVIFGTLATSASLDNIQQEHFDWLKLITMKPSDAKLLNHASKYPWLIFGQFDNEKVLEFLRDRIKEEKGSYTRDFQKILKIKKALVIEQKKIFSKLGKEAKEAKYLATLLQNQSVERMNIKAYWAGCYYLTRKMWQKISESIGVNLSDLLGFLVPDEIESLLLGNYVGYISEVISDRKKGHALDLQGENLRIVGSIEAGKLFKERIKKVESTDVFKGQTAMLGKATGRVRKVIAGDLDMLQSSIREFRHGEILVTSMTQPNMMVLAKKAAAIIADEGGITSHAAIISRELKIPCIVGCLYAMQVLKDGDMVEVDANNGIVKIVK